MTRLIARERNVGSDRRAYLLRPWIDKESLPAAIDDVRASANVNEWFWPLGMTKILTQSGNAVEHEYKPLRR